MAASSKPLTARQAKAVPKILSGRTCEEGCQAAGISKACFYKWMQQEAFRTEYESQRERLADAAMGLLVQNVEKAASVVVELLNHPEARLRRLSAKDLIDHYLRHRELAEIEKSLETIEQRLAGSERKSDVRQACACRQ